MDSKMFAPSIKTLILELIKRKTISIESLNDKMFIHYISTQTFDTDYLKSNLNFTNDSEFT